MIVNASEYIFFIISYSNIFFHCKKKKGQKKKEKKDTPLEYCCNICDSQSVEAVFHIHFLFLSHEVSASAALVLSCNSFPYRVICI